jgi:hypothetical protein
VAGRQGCPPRGVLWQPCAALIAHAVAVPYLCLLQGICQAQLVCHERLSGLLIPATHAQTRLQWPHEGLAPLREPDQHYHASTSIMRTRHACRGNGRGLWSQHRRQYGHERRAQRSPVVPIRPRMAQGLTTCSTRAVSRPCHIPPAKLGLQERNARLLCHELLVVLAHVLRFGAFFPSILLLFFASFLFRRHVCKVLECCARRDSSVQGC